MSTIISQPRYSCALAAQQTVLAIPGGIPIIHAGPGCSSKAYYFSSTESGFQGEGYAGGIHISCTNSTEKEVVFGGEKKLTALIDGTLKIIKGDLFVAMSGCTAGIIGDNVKEVASVFAQDGKPVVGVDTAGFRGNTYFGHEAVVNAIIEQYVEPLYEEKEVSVQKGLVNVFADVPFQDSFWRGDLEEIKGLLEKIGLKVNILFGYSSNGVEEWKNIPNAQANILIGSWCGKKIVNLLKNRFGTPFVHAPVFPVGAKATSAFLRQIGEALDVNSERIENVISAEEKRYYSYLIGMTDFIAEYKGSLPYNLYVVADSFYSLGVTDFLVNEMGFIPRGIYIDDDPPKAEEKNILADFQKVLPEYIDTVKFQPDGKLIEIELDEHLKTDDKALVLGSYWENKIARKTGSSFVNLSMPIIQELIVNGSYAGYSGALHFLEKIYANTFNGLRSAQTNH